MKTQKNLLMFFILVALSLQTGCQKKAEAKEEQLDMRPMVKVSKLLTDIEFRDVAMVQGTLRTKYSAQVAARVGGTLERVTAEEGQTVKAGQPLFQIDKENIENRVRLAQDDTNVAKAAFKEAEAARLEAVAQNEKAQTDVMRMKKLYEQDKAVTKDKWEKADVMAKTTAAALARVDAAVETARVKIVQAETALSIAKKTLADSQGVAPFDGFVTKKFFDEGDFVKAGAPVFAMDNPKIYEVCFTMNAADYDRMTVGETQVELGERFYSVTYKSPSVHPVTRTFEIRATVPCTPELAPGMILDGEVVFNQYKAAGVPTSAVGFRDNAWTVFIVKDGKVESMKIEKGVEWAQNTEIKNPPEALKSADIVTEGMLLLNAGDAVRVTK